MVSQVVRDAVLVRDGFRCVVCGCRETKDNPLQMHHIKYKCHGGGATVENLETLCCDCHRALHKMDTPFKGHNKHKGRRKKCGHGKSH